MFTPAKLMDFTALSRNAGEYMCQPTATISIWLPALLAAGEPKAHEDREL
jgi:hypothetical protein